MSVVIRFVRGYWCAAKLIDGRWLEIAHGRNRNYVIQCCAYRVE